MSDHPVHDLGATLAAPAPKPTAAGDFQQVVGERLMRLLAQMPPPGETDRVLTMRDPEAFVADIVLRATGRHLGARPVWLRSIGPDGQGALFVLSAPSPLDGMDLTVLSHRMPLTRGLVRDVAVWCFLLVGLSRVTVRVRADRPDLQDYARRVGFVFDDLDQNGEQIWVMSARTCQWLPRRICPAPPIAMASPLSLKVH